MSETKKPPTLAAALARARQKPGTPRPEAMEKLASTGNLVVAAREARKKKVWDKLDSAKRRATDKLARVDKFGPAKPGEPEDDDFDL